MISSEGEQWGRDQIYPETIYICMDNGIQWDHDCKLYIINTLQLRNSSADILKNCTCFSADEVPRSPIQASNSSMYGRFTNIYPKMTQFCIYIYIYYLILYTIYILIIYIYIYILIILYIYISYEEKMGIIFMEFLKHWRWRNTTFQPLNRSSLEVRRRNGLMGWSSKIQHGKIFTQLK